MFVALVHVVEGTLSGCSGLLGRGQFVFGIVETDDAFTATAMTRGRGGADCHGPWRHGPSQLFDGQKRYHQPLVAHGLHRKLLLVVSAVQEALAGPEHEL